MFKFGPKFRPWSSCFKDDHLFDYPSDMSKRDSSGKVSCRCAKCGKKFIVDYGIELVKYGKLVRLYRLGSMYA